MNIVTCKIIHYGAHDHKYNKSYDAFVFDHLYTILPLLILSTGFQWTVIWVLGIDTLLD